MRKILVGSMMALGAMGAARAAVIEFNFPIDAAQEIPAPSILPGTNPSGTGFISVNTDTNELFYSIVYTDLSGDIVAPGAHLRGPAGPGSTAGVFLFLAGGTSDIPLPQPPSGFFNGVATITDLQESWILGGLAYVNIHTARNQAGEIRGQVVPEPASLSLLALSGFALLRRR